MAPRSSIRPGQGHRLGREGLPVLAPMQRHRFDPHIVRYRRAHGIRRDSGAGIGKRSMGYHGRHVVGGNGEVGVGVIRHGRVPGEDNPHSICAGGRQAGGVPVVGTGAVGQAFRAGDLRPGCASVPGVLQLDRVARRPVRAGRGPMNGDRVAWLIRFASVRLSQREHSPKNARGYSLMIDVDGRRIR